MYKTKTITAKTGTLLESKSILYPDLGWDLKKIEYQRVNGTTYALVTWIKRNSLTN